MDNLFDPQNFAFSFDDPRILIPLGAVVLFLIAMVLMIRRDDD